jgi:hypothetical protein
MNTVGNLTQWYYNIMGPPLCMRAVADRNVVMRRIPVHSNPLITTSVYVASRL